MSTRPPDCVGLGTPNLTTAVAGELIGELGLLDEQEDDGSSPRTGHSLTLSNSSPLSPGVTPEPTPAAGDDIAGSMVSLTSVLQECTLRAPSEDMSSSGLQEKAGSSEELRESIQLKTGRWEPDVRQRLAGISRYAALALARTAEPGDFLPDFAEASGDPGDFEAASSSRAAE
eukprot:TRINITY_DN24729_c0_g1_i1.p1 TRINITY_DN24729_c0_g1~~TRINITY_DN24729_c0_g1_i1.p1  ORF type:complete len:191 (+),score=35.68 TRINITY_DN24729_c0_g1_i1:55-573(+)